MKKVSEEEVKGFVLIFTVAVMAGASALAAEMDEETSQLIGQWALQNKNGVNTGETLTIHSDGSISDSKSGQSVQGDIQRISGERYKLVFYELDKSKEPVRTKCEVVIQKLSGNGGLSLTELFPRPSKKCDSLNGSAKAVASAPNQDARNFSSQREYPDSYGPGFGYGDGFGYSPQMSQPMPGGFGYPPHMSQYYDNAPDGPPSPVTH